MNNILKEIKDLNGKLSVSIILNTHNTHPDNEKDAILLKNLQKEAEDRISEELDKRSAKVIIDKLDKLVNQIDHRFNTESLALFVNEDIAKYTRLPIAVNNRVIVDTSFATRDLVRALHTQQAYYTLVLGQDRARLIEAANGRVIEELGRPFPIINYSLFTTNATAGSNATRVGNYQKEFFSRVDKALWAIWRENPLPIVISADEKNTAYFKLVSEHNDIIIGTHNDSFDKSPQHIIDANWYIVEEYAHKNNEERLVELKEALNSGKFLVDINDIWNAIEQGRGKTLFVQNGYYQPAKVIDDKITLVDVDKASQEGVIDDIIDEIIEINSTFGGDTVFISDGGLEKFKGLALTLRY
ncbi:hypothetical protein G7050_14310 [Dysgonomonas sp. HDW5A]|uniref:AOC03_06830 family ribosome hibernation factor n=1 Tax=unclassified Dysgonomonas TaxID=2630389 RepID=UPI00140BB926|nr:MULTISPECIES: hypothetical protein [unclassified Dysgonomonas]QIK55530.1 hypothetical protein G7051_14725 [Dysgonomonas sp. HDW5B]QIK60942.1 hypothetical protein G7050_14310 [Dysgonomonas sp. HDW5A]